MGEPEIDLLEAAREMLRLAHRKCADGFWPTCSEHATCRDRQRWARTIAAEEGRRAGAPPPVAAPAGETCARCGDTRHSTAYHDVAVSGTGKVHHDSGSAPTSEAPGPGKGDVQHHGEPRERPTSGPVRGPVPATPGPTVDRTTPPKDPGAREDTEG